MNFDPNKWDWMILAASLVIGAVGIVLFALSEAQPDDGDGDGDDDENHGDC